MIKPFSFFVPFGQLQPFFTPQALNFLVVHMPTFDVKQLCNLARPITPIFLSQADHGQAQSIIILNLGFVMQA